MLNSWSWWAITVVNLQPISNERSNSNHCILNSSLIPTIAVIRAKNNVHLHLRRRITWCKTPPSFFTTTRKNTFEQAHVATWSTLYAPPHLATLNHTEPAYSHTLNEDYQPWFEVLNFTLHEMPQSMPLSSRKRPEVFTEVHGSKPTQKTTAEGNDR